MSSQVFCSTFSTANAKIQQHQRVAFFMQSELPARVARFVCRVHLYSPHPEQSKRHLYEHSLRHSVAPQSTSSPKHFWLRLRCASLRLKTAAVFGPIDCALRLALRFTPTPLLRHGVGRYGLRLWLQTISVNRPKPPLAISGSSWPLRCPRSFGRRKLSLSSFLPPAED